MMLRITQKLIRKRCHLLSIRCHRPLVPGQRLERQPMSYQFTRLTGKVCKNIFKFSTDTSIASDDEKTGAASGPPSVEPVHFAAIWPPTQEGYKKTRPKPGLLAHQGEGNVGLRQHITVSHLPRTTHASFLASGFPPYITYAAAWVSNVINRYNHCDER